MNADAVAATLAELDLDPGRDAELAAVRIALLLEDVFDITLSDDEITPEHLGSRPSIERLLARHGISA